MRLLTEEERQKVGYVWLAEYKEELDAFLVPQDAKTRKETLKAVGEWLEKKTEHTQRGRIKEGFIWPCFTWAEIEVLKRGEMPEEAK